MLKLLLLCLLYTLHLVNEVYIILQIERLWLIVYLLSLAHLGRIVYGILWIGTLLNVVSTTKILLLLLAPLAIDACIAIVIYVLAVASGQCRRLRRFRVECRAFSVHIA